ncbi:hypothetical protein EDB81DRAFT_802107 [Dactylonectria macrodidyma]|uniref:Thioredoxin domain-containing protein n=1 Tax=Dactylonectria macrodidyma TaxID=307937 RepID=A0A9P9IY26_9HYPO|nr:hypothetical protein EDB81DRAFT_802107 [Dactylonectria macrodidyma]
MSRIRKPVYVPSNKGNNCNTCFRNNNNRCHVVGTPRQVPPRSRARSRHLAAHRRRGARPLHAQGTEAETDIQVSKGKAHPGAADGKLIRRAGNSPGALKNFLEQSSVGVVVFDSHTAKYDDVPPLPFVILSGTASLAVVNPEWNPEILKQFEVNSVPSFWIYQNGKHVASLPGNNLIRLFNTLDTFTEYGRIMI